MTIHYVRSAAQERETDQRLTLADTDPRMDRGRIALAYGILCLETLDQADVPRLDLNAIARDLHDALSDLSGECAKHLDRAGLVEDDAAIDLEPLRKFL